MSVVKNFSAYTEFSDQTRIEFIDKILYRFECIYSNWLYGSYYDADLETCMSEDPEYCDLNNLFVKLHMKFRPDIHYRKWSVTPWHWLEAREMTRFPKRHTVVTEPLSEDARPIIATPRRSTRVKFPREFYYGY